MLYVKEISAEFAPDIPTKKKKCIFKRRNPHNYQYHCLNSPPIPSTVRRKDTGPSLLGSLTLSSSSPSPAFYSEAKTASSGSLLNGPLSYSQSSDIIKVRARGARGSLATGSPSPPRSPDVQMCRRRCTELRRCVYFVEKLPWKRSRVFLTSPSPPHPLLSPPAPGASEQPQVHGRASGTQLRDGGRRALPAPHLR